MEKKSLISTIRFMFMKTTTTAAVVGVSCALAACSQTAPSSKVSGDSGFEPSSTSSVDSSTSLNATPSYRVASVEISYESDGKKTNELKYSFKRDESGNLIWVELSGFTTGSCVYEIGEDGQLSSALIKRQGREDESVTYTYDATGRVSEESHNTVYPYEITYDYDAWGRLVRKSCNNQDGPYESEYTYDEQGRLVSEKTVTVVPYATTTEYSYDSDGNVTSAHMIYTNGDASKTDAGSIIYAYEGGKLVSVTYECAQGMLPLSYRYDDNGRLLVASVGEEMGNYDSAEFSYDHNGMLTGVKEKVSTEGSIDKAVVVRTSISYEEVAATDADPSDVSVAVYRGPQRAMDALSLVKMTQHIKGIADPTPFASESSFLLR